MSYTITKKTTPNKDLRNAKPTEIVLHHWGAKKQKIANVVKWLCNSKAGVSAHYVVKSGKVYELADPSSWITWHAGNWNHNKKSIGIEARPERTDGDQETVAELVADLWDRFGIMPIKEHRQIVATSCPGDWSADAVYSDAKTVYDGRHKKKKTITDVKLPSRGYFDLDDEGESVKLIQSFLNKYAKGGLKVDGVYGKKTKSAVKRWQKSVGLEADGLFGSASLKAAKKQIK